jgi:flagellar protein FliS
MRSKLAIYESVSLRGKLLSPTPYEFVDILMVGVLKKCALAKNAINRKNIQDKGVAIGAAISLLDAIQASLDPEKGILAEHLIALCFYMMKRLLEANLLSDISKIEEVIDLLKPIQAAWSEAGK